MKNYFLPLFSVLILSLLMFSCSKDEPVIVDPPSPELTYDVEDSDGTVFVDNQIVEFSALGYPDAELLFYVRNTSSETIAMRIEMESMSGTDGSMMELCFGECYLGVSTGISYPTSPSMPNVNIEPGQTQPSSGDHFLNTDAGDGSTVIEYTFKFYLADESGNQNGTAFRLKYRYLPN